MHKMPLIAAIFVSIAVPVNVHAQNATTTVLSVANIVPVASLRIISPPNVLATEGTPSTQQIDLFDTSPDNYAKIKKLYDPLIGLGFDRFKNEQKTTACVPKGDTEQSIRTTVSPSNTHTFYRIVHITSTKELEEQLGLDSTTELGKGVWKASLAANFAKSTKISSYYEYLLVEVQI